MKRLLGAVVGTAGLLISLHMSEAQAQTSTKPNQPVPSFVTNPWGNPALSYYTRQREMREQRALQQGITQLQRLEMLKARNAKLGTGTEEEGDTGPKASYHLPKRKTTLAATEKTGAGKGKLMLPADQTGTKTDEPSGKSEKVLSRREKQIGGKAPTYSNGYKALLGDR